MKLFVVRLIAFFSLLTSFCGRAQIVKDKSKWTFEAKKKSGNRYDLVFHLKLPHGWRVDSKDDTMRYSRPSSFKFVKNSKVRLLGQIKELGKKERVVVDGWGESKFYKKLVDYVQAAMITGSTKIEGTYKYQLVCDSIALQSTTKKFSFEIK